MTLQEAFNHICRSLLVAPHPSAHSRPLGTTSCLYRGSNDTKCALGHLIPDNLYDRNMEDLDSDELLANFPDLLNVPGISAFTSDQLRLLQQYHDDAAAAFVRTQLLVSDWQRLIREALTNFAADTSLTMEA